MGAIKKISRFLGSIGRRKSFGLNGLDLKLAEYIDFDEGFFVEAGANDGVSQSNTLYLEKYRKWRGLLVEPIPELANRCRKNRRKSHVENVALVPAEFEESEIQIRYCGLMSQVKGAMKSEQAELEHIESGCEVQNLESHELSVPARTLSDLLDQCEVDRIDLLSLDVEGFELPALQGLDFDRHRPKYMLIEAWFRDEIEDYLGPRYEPIAELSHHDVLYRAA